MREEDLQKFSKSLSVCLPRMQRTLQSREKGEDAFNLLSREIEMMKTGAVFAYNWNTTIYTNPVLHLQEFNPLGALSDSKRKDYDQIIRGKANERLERIINGLSLELDELMENNMVVVDHGNPDEHGYPFSLARVNKIYTDASHERFGWIQVTYFTLSLRSLRNKGRISPKNFLTGNFTEDQVPVHNRNKHSKKQAYQAYIDYIQLENIVLVFERLLSRGRIPPRVQDEIRTCARYRDFFAPITTVGQQEKEHDSEKGFDSSDVENEC